MPIYEYRCSKCREDFEVEQKMSDPKQADCPTCGDLTDHRLVSRTSFALKGGGWAKDGY